MTKADELRRLYVLAQKRLVEIITSKSARGSPALYERRILKQIDAELKKLKRATPELVKQLVLQGYTSGLEDAVQDILKQGITTVPRYNAFAGVNLNEINLLIQNTVDTLNKAINIVGRRTEDEIRQAGLRATSLKGMTGGTVKDMQKDLVKRLLGLDLKQPDGKMGVRYKNGVVVSLDKYAEMVSRTTPAEAQNKAKVVQGAEWGYDLVRFTSFFPTCETCAKYQGRTYALTEEAANGKYKGSHGEPLYFPLLYKTALVHGYETIHPRCRHRLSLIAANAYTPQELAAMSQKSMKPFTDTRTDKERRAYAQEQAVKRQRNTDLREWRKYRALLPNDAPTTFAGYRRMKKANSQRYQDLKKDASFIMKGGKTA